MGSHPWSLACPPPPLLDARVLVNVTAIPSPPNFDGGQSPGHVAHQACGLSTVPLRIQQALTPYRSAQRASQALFPRTRQPRATSHCSRITFKALRLASALSLALPALRFCFKSENNHTITPVTFDSTHTKRTVPRQQPCRNASLFPLTADQTTPLCAHQPATRGTSSLIVGLLSAVLCSSNQPSALSTCTPAASSTS